MALIKEKETFSREEVRKTVEPLLNILSRNGVRNGAGDSLSKMRLPVAMDNMVELIFSRQPTQDELDRLAAYIMFVKEFAPKGDENVVTLSDLIKDSSQ